MQYEISYSAVVSEKLTPYFAAEKMWDTDPRAALQESAASNEDCDTSFRSADAKNISVRKFLQVLFSALPRNSEFGQIIGWSRDFLKNLAAKGDTYGLVDITNYVFKSIMLTPPELPPLVLERTLRLMQELHYWANIELHQIRSQDSDYYSFPKLLDDTLNQIDYEHIPKSVVFIFLTEKYFDNFAVWLDLYLRHDHSGEHLLIMTIGLNVDVLVTQHLRLRCAEKSKVISFIPPRELSVCGNGIDLYFLWYVKIHMVAGLLENGLSVVYSDLDAYWIRNYFSIWNELRITTQADLILSATFDMPKSSVICWGFTPCAGFFSVDSTPSGIALLQEWRQMTRIMFDDQIAVAELLFQKHVTWHSCVFESCFLETQVMTTTGSSAKITVLDITIARRVGEPNPNTIENATIWHPRWVIGPDEHRKIMPLIAEMDRPKIH